MTPYLISISIGPVQEFISAARKTADLYAGSELLVRIVQAAAQTFPEGSLIFPSDAKSQGANKILAQIDSDPAEQVQRAKIAAQTLLEAAWQTAWAELSQQQQQQIDTARAKEQLTHLLEFYAAWVPVGNDYPAARSRVERLLAGRKALRDFTATQQSDLGVPKSPLDPSQASVLISSGGALEQAPLKLKVSESLDAVSLLKRVYGSRDLENGVCSTHTLAERAIDLKADLDGVDEDERQPRYSYFAVLVADGDKMGQLLQDKTQAQHRKISGQLDDFTSKANQLVIQYHGQMVYAGGDDVMALLPVTTAVECARQLSEAFRHTVRGTLSAGIAIVHYREPLSVSLERARAAEKAAKDAGRDRLSIALHTRGGSPMTVTRRWEDAGELAIWQAHNAAGKVTRGFPYELRELAREWPAEDFDTALLQAEAARILGRKQAKDGKSNALELPDFANRTELEQFADLLVLARFLSGERLSGAALTDALETK